MKILSFLIGASLLALASANPYGRGGSSQYIYSNDTITLTLAERTSNALHGAVGSFCFTGEPALSVDLPGGVFRYV